MADRGRMKERIITGPGKGSFTQGIYIMNLPRHSRPHRGVLLLVILGLLAMFGLVAVTFVITTGHFRRSSQALHRMDQYRDDPKALLDEAFAQCVRGTNNFASVMGPHSLLEDMYGNDARFSRIMALSQDPTTQFILITPATTLTATTLQFPMPAPSLAGGVTAVAKTPQQCVGSVITFYNGRCAGVSGRIVSYDGTNFAILQTNQLRYVDLNQDFTGGKVYFFINGNPFSGTGFGFSKATPPPTGLNAVYPSSPSIGTGSIAKPYALLPNPAFFPRNPHDPGYNQYYPDPAGPGGANEDYDAPDYQNMLLAMVRPPQMVNGKPDAVPVPIPSLHRPELCVYWNTLDTAGWATSSAAPSSLQRKVILRPLPADHTTLFTGSNPGTFQPKWNGKLIGTPSDPGYFPAGTAQWDVDNDGDGIPDSVWVDLGLPARAGPDGKMYKPLFAILCTDLDGRLNLNAHGSPAQTQTNYYSYTYPTVKEANGDTYYAGTYGAGGGASQVSLPRGQGFGPADVNLNPLFATAANPTLTSTSTSSAQLQQTPYTQLLNGITGTTTAPGIEGRYGELGTATPVPGLPYSSTNRPPFWANRWYEYSGTFQSRMSGGATFDSFGCPPDAFGTMAVGLDLVGWPYYSYTSPNTWYTSGTATAWGGGLTVAGPNSPYEMNLDPKSAWRHIPGGTPPVSVDNPFTPAELERILRPYDLDSSQLPNRLVMLTGAANDMPPPAGALSLYDKLRTMATTESSDAPCPSPVFPQEFLAAAASPALPAANLPALHFLDLLRDTSHATAVKDLIDALPRDLLAGLRMDLNRPFGTGTANTGATVNVVDAPTPVGTAAPTTRPNFKQILKNLTAVAAPNVVFDWSDGRTPPINTPSISKLNPKYDSARVRYARDLYLLAMLMTQTSGYFDPTWKTLYPNITATTEGTVQQLQTARALAQWAVNVVDFRDRDSIMTCFIYDPDPFNMVAATATGPKGQFRWRPTGAPADAVVTVSGSPSTVTAGNDKIATPHVVWGCEFPELLISETLAFHDRRTEDTALETPSPAGSRKGPNTTSSAVAGYIASNPVDPDFDQRKMPQGSLFVELYNPANPNESPAPELEALDKKSNTWSVDLTRTTNYPSAGGDPVWRMVIVSPRATTPAVTAAGTPTYIGPDPDDPDTTSILNNTERVIYFNKPQTTYGLTATSPTTGAAPISYYPSAITNFPLIPPGRYAVVGPRNDSGAAATTTSGSGTSGTSATTTSTTFIGFTTAGDPNLTGAGSPRRIQLTPLTDTTQQQVFVYSSGGTTEDLTSFHPNAVQPPLAFIIDAVTTATTPAASGYTVPRLSVTEPPGGYPPYNDSSKTLYTTPLYDHPFFSDGSSTTPTPYANTYQSNLWTNYLKNSELYPYFRVIYLQRLANPTAPWDPNNNPYRTIDSMQIDLTTFNGAWTAADNVAGGTTNEVVGTGTAASPYAPVLYSRERGWYWSNTGGVKSNLWAHEPDTISPPKVPAKVVTPTGLFTTKTLFAHSFGFLNQAFGVPVTSSGSAPNGVKGTPPVPFPWLTWNNRPFVNTLELLLVPQCRSSQLLSLYNNIPAGTPTPDPYGTFPYPHLPNPFYVGPTATVATASPFARLLDYVTVPSPFASAFVQLDPGAFASPTNTSAASTIGNLPFAAPFNWVSNYHDPGKINLNTIYAPEVWQGLINYFPDVSQTLLNSVTWEKFVQSRRGFGALPTTATVSTDPAFMLDINTSYPTRFVNPFRGPAGAWLVPPTSPPLTTAISGEINTGLLRAELSTAGSIPTAGRRPLFQYDSGTNSGFPTTPKSSTSGLTLNSASHPTNPERNPYFRYQLMEKLSSTTTNRSNVYAVWITVGYFEVTGGAVTQFHPDGYYLGQEMGSDTGDIHRHRAFYIFDRSVPMGFVRGLDLNFDKGILIKRFIE